MVHALIALVVSLLLSPAAANAAVSTAASVSASGTGSASASLTVDGADRVLVVGVSTLESATVTSVTYGAQVLTRREASAKDSSRAEVWTLVAPNTGTATVTVTLSTGAPVVIGATVLTGVDQQFPNLGSNSTNANSGANSASLVLNGTVEADGMVGVLTVNDLPNITAIRTTGSADTVVADQQWTGRQGTILSAGATRRGWTQQNMSLYGGIGWFWNRIDPSHLMPHSAVIAAFKAAAAVPPTAASPTATNVTHDSATLGGSMTGTGGGTILDRGVVYCVCADPGIGNGTKVSINASQVPGALTTTVTGLTPSTTYTYRAYAANGAGTGYSPTATFKTAVPPNLAPTAGVGGPYTVDEGDSLTLAGSGTDPEGAPLVFGWDLNGDGHFEDATGATPTLTPADLAALGLGDGPLTRSVRLAVSDGVNVTLSPTTTLTVRNVAPTATLSAPATAAEGGTATITLTDAHDPSSADVVAGLRYAYDLDDDGTWDIGGATYATAATGASAALALGDGPAIRTVRAAVIDKDGGRTEYTKTVEVRNLAPTVTVSGPEVVSASGEVTLQVAAKDAGPLTGTIDWGDGTVVPFAAGDVSHTYTGPGTRTVTVAVKDAGGAAATATHTLAVASLPAPHTPTPEVTTPVAPPAPSLGGGVLGAVDTNVEITDLRATPRCVRVSDGLKALSSAARTITVQFRVNTAADVKFSFKRWKKPGFTKCPPSKGVAQKGGRKLPGVYSPFKHRPVTAKAGRNTVTLAATGKQGKPLKPGTYLLTVTSGDASARTKVWVLAG